MGGRERVKGIAIVVAVIVLVVSTMVLVSKMSDEGNEKNKRGRNDGNGNPPPSPVIVYEQMNATIKDAFFTDKVTPYEVPPIFSQVFLVFDIELSNPLGSTWNLSVYDIRLGLEEGVRNPKIEDQFVGRAFGIVENMTPASNIRGFLYYEVFRNETLVNLSFRDNNKHVFMMEDLRNLTGLEMRPWRTPLEFNITGCGREPASSGRQKFLYFNLTVTNPSENASHFQCWLIDLFCYDGVKLDGLYVPNTNNPVFLPGWNITYKVYFDIPKGSPDEPKILFESNEGMSLLIDRSLYEGMI